MNKIKIYNSLSFSKEFFYEGANDWCEDEIGNKYFFKNGFVDFISEEEPSIIYINNSKEWLKKGKYHRETGPAKIGLGYEIWYLNGVKHKIDSCAVVNPYDHWMDEYWINGVRLNKHEYDNLPKDDDGKIHSDELIKLSNINFYCWHGMFCENKEEFILLKLKNDLKNTKVKTKIKI